MSAKEKWGFTFYWEGWLNVKKENSLQRSEADNWRHRNKQL